MRRSFASVLTEFSLLNSVIRLLRGEIAGYSVLVGEFLRYIWR